MLSENKSKYVVSTLNRDGSVSKKMLASFGSYPSYCFDIKSEAVEFAKHKKETHFNPHTTWVVVNRKTRKVVA